MPISETARRALYDQTTAEVYLGLITIEHADLAIPMRFTNNTSDLVSRGDTYVAAPFEAQVPAQVEGGEPTVTITVGNTDRVVEQALAGLTSEPDFTYEVVLASAPDVVVLGPFKMPLRSSTTTVNSVKLTLGGSNPLLSRTWPRARFNQLEFPGLEV